MKVLYIGSVGPFGGASRSLYEVLAAMPPGLLDAYFVMPEGSALTFYRRVATDMLPVFGVSRFDHTRASHYRGRRWLVLLREAARALPMLVGFLRARWRWGCFDIVHVNEFTELFPGVIAKHIFGARLVVHVRALVHDDRRLLRTRWIERTLAGSADAVIAIDENVRATLPADLPVTVIHNSFAAEPHEEADARYLAQFALLRPTSLKVGFVGNLLYSKGIIELIRAADLVRRAGADVQLVIVGGAHAAQGGLTEILTRRAGLAYNAEDEVRALIAELELEDNVLLFGPTADIQRVYRQIDVLAFPSHLDAPGRPVFEAAFSGVPSIVAVRDPRPDTLVPDVTGIAIAEPAPEAIAKAIVRFANDRGLVAKMGSAAQRLAERNYVPEANAAKLLALYRRLLSHNAD